MKVFIFDTETTDKDDPEIIEAAMIGLPTVDHVRRGASPEPWEIWSKRFKPSKPITFGAMAVHHIVPSDLVGCEPSSNFHLPIDMEYMVGHSIDFDWKAAHSPEDVKRICTYAMAQDLWPDADSFSQSALLYKLVGESARDSLKGAHSAAVDVANNLTLLVIILKAKPELQTWEEVWKYSEYARIPKFFTWGKWGPQNGEPGKTLQWVFDNDYSYVTWLLRQDWLDERHPYLRRALEAR